MKNRGIRMSTLLTISNLAIVLLVLSGAVFLFARTYQQQLTGTARTNSLRTVTQVSSTVDDYLAEINAVMRTLEEEMSDPEKQRSDFLMSFFEPVRMWSQCPLMILRETSHTVTVDSVRRQEPGQTALISLWICSAFSPSRMDMFPPRML